MKTGNISILCLLGMLFVFSGCQEGLIGREVPVDKRIPLVKKGAQTGRWEAFEYAMNYKYLYTQPKDGAAGAMEFSGSVEKSAGGLDSLSISIYLLDGNGRILAVKDIYDSGYKQRRMDSSFSVTLAPPPDTAGISFAHTAMASRGHK
jgi:hypothetical protein